MLEVSKTFCALPWTHIFANQRGLLFPCCWSEQGTSPICDDLQKPIKIFEDNAVSSAWNSKFMRNMRLEMLAGNRPAICERCFLQEDSGLESYRHVQNERQRAKIPAAIAATTSEGALDENWIDFFDLRLGNLCNLRCRMCNPESSRLLADEWMSIHKNYFSETYRQELNAIDWFDRPEFWEIFSRHAQGLRRLHFAGGEPMLIPGMKRLLEICVERGVSKDIELSYNTNLTQLPEGILALWKKFKHVELVVSIDALGERNDFIRYPSKWAKIEANLQKLDQDLEGANCKYVQVNTTVQILNIYELANLTEYFLNNYRSINRIPYFCLLTEPSYLSIQVLPKNAKEEAERVLRLGLARIAANHPAEGERFRIAVEGVISHLWASDKTSLLPKLRKATEIMDLNRSQSTRQSVPELRQVL